MSLATDHAPAMLAICVLAPIVVVFILGLREGGPVKGWLDCAPGTNVIVYVEPPKPEPFTRSCETCSYRENGTRYDIDRGRNVTVDVCAAIPGKPTCAHARANKHCCGIWARKYQRRLCA